MGLALYGSDCAVAFTHIWLGETSRSRIDGQDPHRRLSRGSVQSGVCSERAVKLDSLILTILTRAAAY